MPTKVLSNPKNFVKEATEVGLFYDELRNVILHQYVKRSVEANAGL